MNDNALEGPTGAPPGSLLSAPRDVDAWRKLEQHAVLQEMGSVIPARPVSGQLGVLTSGQPSVQPSVQRSGLQTRTGRPGSGKTGGMGGVVPAFGRWARIVAEDLVAALLPADCRVCDGPLVGAGSDPICNVCVSGLQPQSEALVLCGVCGVALEMEGIRFARGHVPGGALLCAECRRVRPAFEQAVAFGLYGDELREMVHLLKYERMPGVAAPLGRRLACAIESLHEVAAKELIVVPVPLFPAKQKARGYNQAELLAAAAVRELKRSRPQWKLRLTPEVLRRVRDTESQFALSPRERRTNLAGAFQLAGGAGGAKILGREVLLVDDIYTTGATMRECARVLREGGAAKVWVATALRAQPEIVASWDA